MKTFKNEPKHDFVAKLQQPSLFPIVRKYIEWRQSVRGAGVESKVELEAPGWLAPLSINLDLTTACDFRCDHCIDLNILNNNVKHVHRQLMASLANMIERGLRSVILIGGGEPTIYPRFGEVVRFLKGHGIQVAIVSNGSRNQVIRDIADSLSGNDWVRLSLDSGCNNTFIRMHKPRKAIALEEICSWVPLIRARNSKLPVGFSFVIVWETTQRSGRISVTPNIDEIVMATKLALDYRFSYISFKPFLTRYPGGAEVIEPSVMENFNQTVKRIREAINEAKTYETEDFKVIESTNLKVFKENRWRDFTRQPRVCHMQVFHQVLSPIGLFNCPACRGIEKARIAGKDAYCGINEISATQKSVAAILGSFDASHECADVACLYNSANWWIERAIRGGFVPQELEERHDYFL